MCALNFYIPLILNATSKLAESCSSSSSCSCSIFGTSAPKREPDPSAIILFHHFDREICRILEDEHDFSTSRDRERTPMVARPSKEKSNPHFIAQVNRA